MDADNLGPRCQGAETERWVYEHVDYKGRSRLPRNLSLCFLGGEFAYWFDSVHKRAYTLQLLVLAIF